MGDVRLSPDLCNRAHSTPPELMGEVTLEHLFAAALTPDWEEQERKVGEVGISSTMPERSADLRLFG